MIIFYYLKMSSINSKKDHEPENENVKTFNRRYLQDFNLDNVSSEDDDFEPLSGIIKRIIEDNKTSTNLLDSPQNIDK